jgi:hypothetical protein
VAGIGPGTSGVALGSRGCSVLVFGLFGIDVVRSAMCRADIDLQVTRRNASPLDRVRAPTPPA